MAIKFIKVITFSRLSNSYHVAFMSNVRTAIDAAGFENLGIPEYSYNDLEATTSKENMNTNRSTASALTTELQNLDTLRDNYFRRIYYKLRSVENDSLNEAVTPEILNILTKKIFPVYPLSICSDGNQKQTAQIRGFIMDLRVMLQTSFTLLGITDDVNTLEEANDNYEKKYMERITERNQQLVTLQLREETEDAYYKCMFALQSTANTLAITQEEKAKKKAASSCIDDINLLIQDFKTKAYTSASGDENVNDNENDNENPEAEPEVTPDPETPNV